MSAESSGAGTPGSAPGTTCPTCGAPAQRGQLVCLECGGRIALTYRRPPSWKIPVAITAVVAALVVAGAALAYSAIDDDAKQEAAATPAQPKAPPATDTNTETETTKTTTTETTTAPAPKKKATPKKAAPAEPAGDAIVKKGALYTWPKTLSDFTVVLLSSEDRASATTFARSAAAGGSDKIGVIRSDDFKTLPKGFYVVFAGQYPNRAKADKAAARLGKRFQGAFTQAVTR
jgi:septal ring-binding cell division protein DamX